MSWIWTPPDVPLTRPEYGQIVPHATPASHCKCPECKQDGHWLEDISRDALVNYYRCDGCGCVWNVRKDDPTWTTMVHVAGSAVAACLGRVSGELRHYRPGSNQGQTTTSLAAR